MMKNFLKPALVAIAGLYFTMSPSYIFGGLSVLLGLILLAWAIWLFIKAIKHGPVEKVGDPFKQRMAEMQYSHFYRDSGVALDTGAKEIHLLAKGVHKVYPYAKIRTWETNVASGGMILAAPGAAASLAATAANMRQSKINKSSTGLFFEVKDIDFPKWQIEFPAKNIEYQLQRWMEILRQEVNES